VLPYEHVLESLENVCACCSLITSE